MHVHVERYRTSSAREVVRTMLIFTFPWRGKVDARSAAGWGESARSALRIPAPPSTPPRVPSGRDPPPPGEGETSDLILATRSAPELRARRVANWQSPLRYPPLATCLCLPSNKKGRRNAGKRRVPPPHLTDAARALLERARLTAFHHGSRLRELFHPKGSAQARLPGTRSERALPAFACPSPGSTSRPGHRAGGLIPKPPGSGLQIRPRAPHPLHLTACLR
jgi:hypothetical protein